MISIKTPQEIAALREGGKRLARILRLVSEEVVPGVSTDALNDLADKLVREGGDEPAFLNYTPAGATRPYPATLCVSINDEVQHGIPNEHPQILKEGDLIDLDCGLIHKGMVVDSGLSVGVGKIRDEAQKLMDVTQESLAVGIKAARGGNRVGDIGHAIEAFVKPYGYGIVYELCGHGVGYKVHEEPQVLNLGEAGTGPKLKPGMVIAIEPMLNMGSPDIYLADDGYTFKTKDGSLSAHFEHTIAITDGEAEILTKE